ncbi:DASH complex subunit Spc34 [Plectosphaerella plurivora]|uniref:DASH complex subunit SPC34 n=1 Tax=Plectosphaerella plurivora TaxID=936078 RepID=A0A9P8VAX1_9PEZI|nr:DASH complex subunit Spc34 [Plectosphaerella plurivora]
MSSLLGVHLEQIALCCQGIDSLPFPQPKIFTNALLYSDDITSLIRDTEPHERALFSVPPPPPPASAPQSQDPKLAAASSDRRKTVFAVSSGEVTTSGGPRPGARRNTAVAAVLGGELHGQLSGRRKYGSGEAKGDVDVEVLLQGAEKLCGVYALPGATEKITSLRSRWARNKGTVQYYESRVAELAESVERNKGHWRDDEEEEEEVTSGGEAEGIITEEDLRAEEEEARELDRKKRELQQRIRSMDKDLGGLLRM